MEAKKNVKALLDNPRVVKAILGTIIPFMLLGAMPIFILRINVANWQWWAYMLTVMSCVMLRDLVEECFKEDCALCIEKSMILQEGTENKGCTNLSPKTTKLNIKPPAQNP